MSWSLLNGMATTRTFLNRALLISISPSFICLPPLYRQTCHLPGAQSSSCSELGAIKNPDPSGGNPSFPTANTMSGENPTNNRGDALADTESISLTGKI